MSRRINRKQLEELLLTTPDLNATARIILLAYASTMHFTDEVQETWQSDERIMSYCGIGQDTLTAFKRALIADGYLITVRTTKDSNNRVKTYRVLGRGTPTQKKLMRRGVTERQRANLIPDAHGKKKKGTLGQSESVQQPDLDNVQQRYLDNVETNTKSVTKGNKAGSVADAPSQEPQENEDREDLDLDGSLISSENKKTGEARKTEPSSILKNMTEPSSIPTDMDGEPISTTETRAVLDNVQVTPVLHVKDLDGNYSYFVKHSPERGEARLLGIEWEFDSHLRIPGWSERQALRAAKKKAGVSA